jgi:hypothetical protein
MKLGFDNRQQLAAVAGGAAALLGTQVEGMLVGFLPTTSLFAGVSLAAVVAGALVGYGVALFMK